ncbi:hypothetical protein [Tabrizicola sp. BL-A-41-H6]|uniref:hypothetical protein n=1 Tax=Tabrizicola sp. BL-A-41-H6 TaxID=3421107 RepID=UPI003D67B3B1
MTADTNDRLTYIGSSDARGILAGDYDRIWREKKGFLPKPDFTDNFAVQMGVIVEPFHAAWTIRKLNAERDQGFEHSLHTPSGEQHFASATTSGGAVLGSHPDGLVRHASGAVYPLEVKHTGRFQNAGEAAQFYMPQLQHHMFCWGVDRLLFSVIVGNDEPERLWIGSSPEWLDHYVQRCEDFWRYVREDRAPPPKLYDTDAPIVPTTVADTVPINGFKRRDISADNYVQAMVPEFLTTKAAAKRHDEIKDELKKLMKPDENELYSPAITLKRDAKGAIRFTVKEEKAKAA